MKRLKEKVLEVVSIAQECPENLQQICFEILLKHTLGPQGVPTPVPPAEADKTVEPQQPKQEPTSVIEEAAKSQDDLSSKELHLKVRRFLQKYNLNVDHLNQLFYKEYNEILPLYDDLKTTRTSESQVRLTLLLSLRNAISTGEFKIDVEEARREASTRKCYDVNNWRNNYNNNAILFDFEKYTKNVKVICLSEQGKSKLADLIMELQ